MLMAVSGTFLARLEHEGVAAGDGHRIHPEGDHRREVEGGDAGADAERLANGLAINAAGDVFQRLAHQQRGRAAGELNHLDAAFDIAARFDERLAVFAGVEADQLLEMLLQQGLETEQDSGAVSGGRFRPGGEGSGGGLDGIVHVTGGAEGVSAMTLPVDGLWTGVAGRSDKRRHSPPIQTGQIAGRMGGR